MNNSNLNWTEEENRLRSWTPRGPSAAVERRVFGRARAPAAEVPAPAWHWLAPALACCTVMLVLARETGPVASAGGQGSEVALWSGPFPSPQLRQIGLEHNLFAVFREPSLGWTNGGESPSTIGSYSLLRTNGF